MIPLRELIDGQTVIQLLTEHLLGGGISKRDAWLMANAWNLWFAQLTDWTVTPNEARDLFLKFFDVGEAGIQEEPEVSEALLELIASPAFATEATESVTAAISEWETSKWNILERLVPVFVDYLKAEPLLQESGVADPEKTQRLVAQFAKERPLAVLGIPWRREELSHKIAEICARELNTPPSTN